MKTYFAVVHKDPDSAYGIHFPDVPGCFSAADDQEDIAANASEALALHLEGEEAPEASDIETVRKLAAEDLEEGAALIAVPLITLSARQVRANISMDAAMLTSIDNAARARKMTRSGFIVEAVRNEIAGRRG